MAFESVVAPDNWKSAVIVPLYKGKGERTECKNLLNVVGKIYAGILVDRFCRATGSFIDEDQWGFRVARGCVE